ncbi:DUF1822 family protein [Mastigocoleus testarum]|nr:DUF1822 family protein [Mastigocoleus testarum]
MSTHFEPLPIETIYLDSEDISRAVEVSNKIPNYSRQWQTYLNALTLCIFEKWLEERYNTLTVDWEESTINKPALANLIPATTNLKVGEFKICLITIPSIFEEQVSLSKIVVDIPEFVPYFYVLVEVLEEQECGCVRGFLSYSKLLENLENIGTIEKNSLQTDWNYQIPLTCFENNPNNLLLYLRALEPTAISLPAIPSDRREILAAMESEFVKLLPNLRSPETEFWQVLNWEQATAVLTNIELVDWIYNLQIQTRNHQTQNNQTQNHQTHNLELNTSVRDLIQLLVQPAINVGRWLWDELDEVGEQLSWTLLPSFASATAFRSPLEEFEAIKLQLETQGIEISSVARSGYHDFVLAGIPLRLYAVTWNSSTENEPSSWSLLLILGTPVPDTLPENLKLRVSDQTGILVEQGVNPEQVESYLYTCVAGNWNEKFIVTASLSNGVEVTLPPFAFDIRR